MSKIEELKQIYDAAEDAAQCVSIPGESFIDMMHRAQLAGIAAVVRALRDEIDRIWIDEDMGCGTILDVFNQILGAAGDEVAHICDGDEGPSLHQTPATDPAPAPCLWRVHHETRNGPLYVSQCDGEWRHATADPKCPSCGKEIFFPTAPAPAVCVWTDVGDAYRSACGRSHFAWTSRGGVVVCPECKAPIKFTEAK